MGLGVPQLDAPVVTTHHRYRDRMASLIPILSLRSQTLVSRQPVSRQPQKNIDVLLLSAVTALCQPRSDGCVSRQAVSR